uniref:Retinoic acid receptor responder protein 3-like n=1 Tax=Gouania willdenowi TaxID=441366 RepID=A0A8C5DQM4_GOUWI
MAPTRRDEKPKAGDCIEIFRGNYQHWALDVGDGCVVHLAPPCEAPGGAANKMVSVLCEKALVQKNGLWDVVGNHEWRVNNDLDKKYEHRPVQVIVRDALDVVGCELPYNVVTRNCEHFVNELRYGKAESRQIIRHCLLTQQSTTWPRHSVMRNQRLGTALRFSEAIISTGPCTLEMAV